MKRKLNENQTTERVTTTATTTTTKKPKISWTECKNKNKHENLNKIKYNRRNKKENKSTNTRRNRHSYAHREKERKTLWLRKTEQDFNEKLDSTCNVLHLFRLILYINSDFGLFIYFFFSSNRFVSFEPLIDWVLCCCRVRHSARLNASILIERKTATAHKYACTHKLRTKNFGIRREPNETFKQKKICNPQAV